MLVLILCLSFSALYVPKLEAQSPNIFGYSVAGSYSDNALDFSSVSPIILCNYTSPSDLGTITQLSVYMNAVSDPVNASVCIYNSSFGFLVSSTKVLVGNNPDWVNFTLNYVGSPNTVYWLGVFASGDFNFYWDGDNDATHVFTWTNDNLTFNNLPDPFVPNPTYSGSDIVSIYATYALATSPTPTPTDTPTPTPTQSPTPTPTTTDTPTPTPTSTSSDPTPTATFPPYSTPTSTLTPTVSPTPTLKTSTSTDPTVPEYPAQPLIITLIVSMIVVLAAAMFAKKKNSLLNPTLLKQSPFIPNCLLPLNQLGKV